MGGLASCDAGADSGCKLGREVLGVPQAAAVAGVAAVVYDPLRHAEQLVEERGMA